MLPRDAVVPRSRPAPAAHAPERHATPYQQAAPPAMLRVERPVRSNRPRAAPCRQRLARGGGGIGGDCAVITILAPRPWSPRRPAAGRLAQGANHECPQHHRQDHDQPAGQKRARRKLSLSRCKVLPIVPSYDSCTITFQPVWPSRIPTRWLVGQPMLVVFLAVGGLGHRIEIVLPLGGRIGQFVVVQPVGLESLRVVVCSSKSLSNSGW